jgi:hypothetical protein
LFDVGDLTGEKGRFVAWDTPLEESMRRIYDMYVTHHDNRFGWELECWLKLTEKGLQVARTLEEKCEDSPG